ncbi:MAG: nucleoside-triphosphatase [Acetivibrio ethanolgignens]
MKRRLFLTGAIGCGKSTAIEQALGNKISSCCGFLTRRIRDEQGKLVSFSLLDLSSGREEVFLDFSSGHPEMYMAVFKTLGAASLRGDLLVLDEIGGIELLCTEFAASLKEALTRDVPILGVMKGEGPANALIQALGLSEEYKTAANQLRKWLQEDEETLLYTCNRFDENALLLAKQWAEVYVHEELF